MITYNAQKDCFEGDDDIDDEKVINIDDLDDLIDNAETDEDNEEPTADEFAEAFIGS